VPVTSGNDARFAAKPRSESVTSSAPGRRYPAVTNSNAHSGRSGPWPTAPGPSSVPAAFWLDVTSTCRGLILTCRAWHSSSAAAEGWTIVRTGGASAPFRVA